MALAILDFSDPYLDDLISILNELNVKTVLLTTESKIQDFTELAGLIITGKSTGLLWKRENIFNLKIPILGFGYGYKIICEHFGAIFTQFDLGDDYQIRKLQRGSNNIENIISGINNHQILYNNTDYITFLPTTLWVTARTEDGCIAAVEHISQRVYALKFYPQAKETIAGKKILHNFLKICNV